MAERNVAVVAGATGLVGQYLVRILLEDAFFDQVVVLTRRPWDYPHPKLSIRPADFQTGAAGATHVFCCLGTTMRKAGGETALREVDYGMPLALARSAASAGARRFLLISSVGASPRAGSFYLRVKGELEEALRALPFEALHLFRPSILLGPRAEQRPGERFGIALARAFEWALAGPLRKYRPCPAPMLARAMAVSAERGPAGVQVFAYDDIRRLGG